MSETPVVNAVQVPAPKLTSIQLIEQEIVNFGKQAEQAAKNAEQAVANVHAVQGAIQGAQHLLAKLRAAEASAAAEVTKVETEVVNKIHAVEAVAKEIL